MTDGPERISAWGAMAAGSQDPNPFATAVKDP